MGKNGKQYLNIVHVCLHFVQQKYMTIITTAIHAIIIITCTTYSIAVISLKSSIISSSFGKLMGIMVDRFCLSGLLELTVCQYF